MKAIFQTQYIDRQYIDNTSSADRMLEAYWVNDLILNYSFSLGKIQNMAFQAKINNIFNEQYITNGWAYRYLFADANGNMQEYAMDGYFPQAGINFLVGISVKF